MQNNKRVVVVLGVYRSGTSALTKGLEVMGIPLMDLSSTFYDDFNEKGYWEDLDFHGLNIKLLKTLDTLKKRRRSIMPLTEEEVNFLDEQGFLAKASQLLLEKLPHSAPLGIKDPKFSILLPFWKKVFKQCNIRASFVIALRNPLNVVASITASHKVLGKPQHQEKSFWVWISYLLSCLEHSEGHERLLIDFDTLLKNPAHQIKRIAHAFELEIHHELLKTYCDDFIDASLCHFEGDHVEVIPDHFGKTVAMEMYETLLAVARDQTSFYELKDLLKKWRETFLAAQSLLVLAEKNEYTIQELQQTIHVRDQSLHELQKTINKNAFSIAGYCQTIHQRDLQIASLAEEQAKRDNEIFQLREQLEK